LAQNRQCFVSFTFSALDLGNPSRISGKTLRILEVEANLWQTTIKIFVILACTVLRQSQSVTDGQTGRQTDASTIAKMPEALHAVARENHVPF